MGTQSPNHGIGFALCASYMKDRVRGEEIRMTGPMLLAQAGPYHLHWQMHQMGWNGWTVGMMLGMLLFWGLVIAGAVAGIRWLLKQNNQSDGALEILRRRYARGEIDREKFDAMRRDLN
jgi:putative membrane protein